MNAPWFSEKKYKPSPNTNSFVTTVKGEKFFIVINPNLGSWAAMRENEAKAYLNGDLPVFSWENLFIRGLAVDSNDTEAVINSCFPAKYPSVVVINTTLNCDLECKYCFANSSPSHENQYSMQDNVSDAIVERMMALPDEIKIVTFEFQGGEPLLNFHAIKRIVLYAEELAPFANKEVKFRVETNGTIYTDEICVFFKEHSVPLGISLDGPSEINDRARIFPDGDGSSNKALEGLDKFRLGGVEVTGGVCTIGKHNVSQPEALADFYKKISYNFKPRPMNLLGRAIESDLVASDEDWFKCFKSLYFSTKNSSIINYSIPIYEENVYTPIRDYICLRSPCGAGRELISINPNGDVFPCDGFKSYGEFAIGNILNEPIVEMLKKPLTQKLRDRTWKDIPKCSKCIYRGMCGSCIYSCYGAFNDIYREDPQCKSRKLIFKFLIKQWIIENMFDL